MVLVYIKPLILPLKVRKKTLTKVNFKMYVNVVTGYFARERDRLWANTVALNRSLLRI